MKELSNNEFEKIVSTGRKIIQFLNDEDMEYDIAKKSLSYAISNMINHNLLPGAIKYGTPTKIINEINDIKIEDLTFVNTISMNRENFEKLIYAIQLLPMPIQIGNKMRIIIDYDPQKSCVKFNYFIDEEE